MTDQQLRINLNLAALWSKYLVQLQHLLDAITLMEAGVGNVTEAAVAEVGHFMAFHPAGNSRLSFAQGKDFANDWLLKGFLRDSIERTGLFLDECLSVCALIEIAAKGIVSGSEINQVLNVLPQKNHRLHLPEKLSKLEKAFGVNTPFNEHVLSINRARTCVVHRLGVVTAMDADQNGELKVTWRTTEMTAKDLVTGKETTIIGPMMMENESSIGMRFIDHTRAFKVGEHIKLTVQELYACIVTFWAFAMSMAEAIQKLSQSRGLGPHEPMIGQGHR